MREPSQRIVVVHTQRVQRAHEPRDLGVRATQSLRRGVALSGARAQFQRSRLERALDILRPRAPFLVARAQQPGAQEAPFRAHAPLVAQALAPLSLRQRHLRLAARELQLPAQKRDVARPLARRRALPQRDAEHLELALAERAPERGVRGRAREEIGDDARRISGRCRVVRLWDGERGGQDAGARRGGARAPRVRLRLCRIRLGGFGARLRVAQHRQRRFDALVRVSRDRRANLGDDRFGLVLVLREELSSGSHHLNRLAGEAGGFLLRRRHQPDGGPLRVLVRVERARALVRDGAFPSGVAVDVRAQNAPEPLGAVAPHACGLLRLGSRRERLFLQRSELLLGVRQLSLHVHLPRAVPHQHVLLVGHAQKALGHLLRPRVRLRALVPKAGDVRLLLPQPRLGELAPVRLLACRLGGVLRVARHAPQLAVVALVVLELLHLVAQPVALKLRGVAPLLERRHLARRRRALADALQRLLLDLGELLRHLRVAALGVHALAPLVLPRAVQQVAHLGERRVV